MVSRERIHSHPKAEYIRYREWLLNTKLSDTMSGRVMEYSWQYLFTGQPEACPKMNQCYCDGYGICFGGPDAFKHWFDLRDQERAMTGNISVLHDKGKNEEAKTLEIQRNTMRAELERLKKEAFDRGTDPKNRAVECGRPWKEGDGF